MHTKIYFKILVIWFWKTFGNIIKGVFANSVVST